MATPTQTPTSDLSSFLADNPTVARLYDNVQAVVPAVTQPMIEMQAWNAIEEFYLRSTARREHVFWQMPSGVYAVNFDPFDANWHVCWILGYTGLTNAIIRPPAMLRDVQWPQSTVLRNGEALLALKPASFASSLGSLIWQQWFETILDGTLGRLYMQPAKPYSSPQQAAYYGARYRAGIQRARDIAQRQFTNSGGRWQVPYFAMGKRKQ